MPTLAGFISLQTAKWIVREPQDNSSKLTGDIDVFFNLQQGKECNKNGAAGTYHHTIASVLKCCPIALIYCAGYLQHDIGYNMSHKTTGALYANPSQTLNAVRYTSTTIRCNLQMYMQQ